MLIIIVELIEKKVKNSFWKDIFPDFEAKNMGQGGGGHNTNQAAAVQTQKCAKAQVTSRHSQRFAPMWNRRMFEQNWSIFFS